MPFTFSHPAIILPLMTVHKNRLSATALVIGSMAPDFEYFMRMEMHREHSHSLTGLFFFELPVTLVCCILYHAFVRNSLIKALPKPISDRFAPFIGLDWFNWAKKYWYVLIYSALIGAFSHLLWDSFTHSTGFFARRIPFLLESSSYFGIEMRNCDWGQLISTIIGGMAIFVVVVFPVRGSFEWASVLPKLKYWITVSLVLLVVLFLRKVENLGDVIATVIAGGLLGLIIAPVILKSLKRL